MKTLFKAEECLLLGIDIQERLLEVMFYKDRVLKNGAILLKAARLFKIKTIISEQYPKGLGASSKKLDFDVLADFNDFDEKNEKAQVRLFEKSSFSVFNDAILTQTIASLKPKKLMIFGIESHVCVLQSVLMALENYEVYVFSDALSSRTKENHENALNFMQNQGAKIINTESFLFGLMQTFKDENFKAVSALIK